MRMKFASAIAIALAIAAASPFIAASPFVRWIWGKIREPLIIAVEGATAWTFIAACPFIIWAWEKIREPLINAVKGEICYLFHYDHNIHKVRVEAEKLVRLKERVYVAEDGVQTWLDDVDVITAWVKNLMKDKAKVDESCLGGWCHCISRYQLSKKAKHKTDEITALHEKGSNFNILSHPALPSLKDFRTFPTRASVTEEIMDALKDDNTHIIGICGVGGVGKTTLVNEIGRRAQDIALFNRVVMVKVSETPSLTQIQEEIARLIGCESHRESLWQKIKSRQVPVLIILDDVRGKLDLGAVGIPFWEDHWGCKVVLTSRSHVVCKDMGVQKIVPVHALGTADAWVLFKEMAGGEAVELNPIAREVSDECGGVPLVIMTIAAGLKNKNQHVWAARARQLKNANLQQGMEKNVFAKLELSFNYLEREEAKLLFLLCSLFPEDHDISVEDLMRYAIGLKVFGDVNTIEEARYSAHDVVSTLIDSFMLLDGSKKGFVKMHGVLRDFALYISSKHDKYRFKVMSGLKNWPDTETFENYSAISLISNDINELPHELSAPKLQTLRIQCNSQLQIPDDFFKGSKDQLIFLEMSGIHFKPILPPSLQPLSNTLRTLHLTSCKLGDISMIATLKNLEILSFSGSEIGGIPCNIVELSRLKLLDLTNCKMLSNIVPGVICRLPRLEELYLPQRFNFDNLVELNSLSRLACLQIFIPIDLLHIDLTERARELTSFDITFGIGKAFESLHVYNKPYPYVNMRSLTIDHDGPIQPIMLDWVKLLLKKTKHLFLGHLKNLNNIFSELNEEGFNELKSLELGSLKGTEYLVNTKESTPQMAFSSLEVLSISNTWSFIEICPGQLPDNSFRNVRELHVDECINMQKLVSSSLLGRLKNLEKLRVYKCYNLVHVFEEHVVAEVSLSKLKEIVLDSLSNTTHIWKDGPHQFISLCNLEQLCVCCCPKLRKLLSPKLLQWLVRLKYLDVIACHSLEVLFGHDEEQDTETAVPFLRSLTRVSVYHCENLRRLFSTSIVKGDLEKLECLNVSRCYKLQNVIEDKKGKQEAASVEFPCLSSISLIQLYKLKSFCTGYYTIEWPSLERLDIRYCSEMETFGYGDQLTPQLKKIVKHESEGQEIVITINGGDLNHAVQNHFGPKATTPEAGPSQSSS
ncbi:probable disease resistance protein At4g27220 [Cornus florida]|uniref:probable disease resistance protein At4g27220 n=1 Tax=Cornus florida TaxID=4283 RepID=UPI002899C1B9|nr:probable disease resistance protein At4g27220 [Cornus florida]XP_059655815.1 probable disease resistance protein At4g27220 [Cornus florida]